MNLEFVKLDGSTPEALIVAEDLSTPRVSWDIIEKDVIPQNVFVEIKKDDVEIARRIAKTNGISAAFDYLESVVLKFCKFSTIKKLRRNFSVENFFI